MHLHEVRDSDNHFIIDDKTMHISNSQGVKNTLMMGDHNCEIFTFEIPQFVEGHDMSLCDTIRIHFINISSDKVKTSKSFYTVTDAHVDEDSGKFIFSWLISGESTMHYGNLNFRIQFGCTDENGKFTYKKHTEIFKGIAISDGFDNTVAAIEEYADIIAHWTSRIEALENGEIDLTGYATEEFVTEAIENIEIPEAPKNLSDLQGDSTHRVVTDEQIAKWNAKSEKGEDGISPTVSMSDITGGTRLTITDISGAKTTDIMRGRNIYIITADSFYSFTSPEDETVWLQYLLQDSTTEHIYETACIGDLILLLDNENGPSMNSDYNEFNGCFYEIIDTVNSTGVFVLKLTNDSSIIGSNGSMIFKTIESLDASSTFANVNSILLGLGEDNLEYMYKVAGSIFGTITPVYLLDVNGNLFHVNHDFSSYPEDYDGSAVLITWLMNITGKDGEQGKSAYDIAVENGFVGTEAAWLSSLKGKDGYSVYVGNDILFVTERSTAEPTALTKNLSGFRYTSSIKDNMKPNDIYIDTITWNVYTFVTFEGDYPELPYTWRLNGKINGSDATITVDAELSETSENPVQNKVVAEKFNELSGEIADLKTSKWFEKKFVSFGDSITWQDGRPYNQGNHIGEIARGYQTIIKETLGFNSYLNKGLDGKPIAGDGGIGDSARTVSYDGYDLVIIAGGTNDFKLNVPIGQIATGNFDTTTFYGAYQSMVEYIIRQKQNITICLFTPLQRNNSGYNIDTTNTAGHKLIDYVNAIKAIGERYSLPVCDMYSNVGITLINVNSYTMDGLHPTDIGYKRIGSYGSQFINQIPITTELEEGVINYSITFNLTNCSGVSGNANSITEGTNITLQFTVNDGYILPDSVTVANATVNSWDKSTGTLIISNPTSNVSITISATLDDSIVEDIINPQNYVTGSLVDGGTIYYESGILWETCDYIEINTGDVISFKDKARWVAVYDADKNYVDGTWAKILSSEFTTWSYTAVQNGFIRFTILPTYNTNNSFVYQPKESFYVHILRQ